MTHYLVSRELRDSRKLSRRSRAYSTPRRDAKVPIRVKKRRFLSQGKAKLQILELGLAGSQKVSFSGKSDESGRVKKRRFLSQGKAKL